eukprot:933633-Alexandrium_andersonii.AAC.1
MCIRDSRSDPSSRARANSDSVSAAEMCSDSFSGALVRPVLRHFSRGVRVWRRKGLLSGVLV